MKVELPNSILNDPEVLKVKILISEEKQLLILPQMQIDMAL
ncbi:hypothetical protein LEP1GSC170_1524 [Leptospira interrogans serovar Bataviae str. HAI135]|nr:hypothetical protein LEP1GSC170_1524 [Leptospira interrogans serovar Bataviae str. HAI135]